MERVTLLIERTGARISCLLNPENLEARRSAGVRRRRGAGGVLTGTARSDDPLIATGGGVTEYDLYLLFDVEVAREGRAWAGAGGRANQDAQAVSPADVRELTRPLWDLTENSAGEAPQGPPCIRLIWGKSWNVPGMILAVAERLEQFDANGAPQRSWLSLRLRRVNDAQPEEAPQSQAAPATEPTEGIDVSAPAPPLNGPEGLYDRIEAPVDNDGSPLNRLDLIAADRYGDPGLAPALAAYNRLDEMLRLPPGAILALPPVAVLRGAAG